MLSRHRPESVPPRGGGWRISTSGSVASTWRVALNEAGSHLKSWVSSHGAKRAVPGTLEKDECWIIGDQGGQRKARAGSDRDEMLFLLHIQAIDVYLALKFHGSGYIRVL